MEESNQDFSPEIVAQVEAKRRKDAEAEYVRIGRILQRVRVDIGKQQDRFPDLSNELIYYYHSNLLMIVANKICLRQQRREFIVDDDNSKILRFLLYYFNDCDLALDVFPDKHYKLEKNLLLIGKAGVGKTLLMQIFSEYLRRTANPNFFHNLSVTQMVNYYTIHNNLDRYTYNEEAGGGFEGKPVNVCLNDIGLQSRLHYGQDTAILTQDFLHARNEIWTQTADNRKFAHLTTNLSISELKEKFRDDHNRLVDRFKTYNVITLPGTSRR